MTQASNTSTAEQLATLIAEGKHEAAKQILRSLVKEATKNAGKSPLLDTLRAHLAMENKLLAEYEGMLRETLENTATLDTLSTKVEDTAELQKTRKSLQ